MKDELELNALKLLEADPELSQRQLAGNLGISVGAANYCVKALVSKGWLKLENFQKNQNKMGYVYLLTPSGILAKTDLTKRFLKRKLQEYERLEKEIAALRTEVEQNVVMESE